MYGRGVLVLGKVYMPGLGAYMKNGKYICVWLNEAGHLATARDHWDLFTVQGGVQRYFWLGYLAAHKTQSS